MLVMLESSKPLYSEQDVILFYVLSILGFSITKNLEVVMY